MRDRHLESRPSDSGDRLSRRTLLVRTGGAVLAATAASAGLLPALGQADSKLSDERQEAFAALVEALGSTPDSIVDGRKADRVAEHLARRYRDEPKVVRRNLDAILDELVDIEPRGKRLREAPVEERRMEVQERLDDDDRRGREMSKAFLVGQAIALASEPFAPGAFDNEVAL